MSEPDGAGPKARTIAFRDSVVLYLHEAGVTEARRPDPEVGWNGRDRYAHDRGEVHGLPWALNVVRQKTLDLSGSLDRVQRRAGQESSDLYALIAYRRGHGVGEAYVVMPLSIFARVVPVHLP